MHRSGRTGRAGKKGTAILIYSSNQYRDVKHIEREVGCRFNEVLKMLLRLILLIFFSVHCLASNANLHQIRSKVSSPPRARKPGFYEK